MKIARTLILIFLSAAIAGVGGSRAQTRELATNPNTEQSRVAESSSAMSKVRTWTRTRWETARKMWKQDNDKFLACSTEWREKMNGRKHSLHDQRDFLFQCMNDTESPSTAAAIQTWTREHWDAARLRSAQDHAKFYGCRDQVLDQTRQRRISAQDARELFFGCMNEIS